MYLRNLLTRQGDNTALLVEKTRPFPRRKHPAELDSSHWAKNLQLASAGEGGEQMDGVQAANATHPAPHAHEKATCRGLTLCMSEKNILFAFADDGGGTGTKSGCTDIPGGERTAVGARSAPPAFKISTMRESDSSHGAKMLRLALANEGGG